MLKNFKKLEKFKKSVEKKRQKEQPSFQKISLKNHNCAKKAKKKSPKRSENKSSDIVDNA